MIATSCVRRWVVLLAAFTAWCGPPAATALTGAELLADLPLSESERQRVLRGELVTRDAREGFDRELAVSMTFLIRAPRERVVQVLSEAGVARANPETTAYGEVLGNGALDNFANLRLMPNGAAETRRYLAAHPGETLNLDVTEIATFDALSQTGAATTATVEAQLHQMLLARHRTYKAKGLAGIAPYTRAAGTQYQPADDLRRATTEERVVKKYLPVLADLLLNYPSAPPPGFRERFFWLNYDIDDRPTFVLAHRMVLPSSDAYALVTRQFYVSHSYNVVQEIALLIPTTEGTVVFYDNRTSTDQAAGFGSAMKHAIGRAMMDKDIAAMFETLRSEAVQKDGAH